jgi:hypothetical protein
MKGFCEHSDEISSSVCLGYLLVNLMIISEGSVQRGSVNGDNDNDDDDGDTNNNKSHHYYRHRHIKGSKSCEFQRIRAVAL